MNTSDCYICFVLKPGFFILFQFLALTLFGQEDYFRINELNVEDGLSFRHITAITQDHQGYIWIGTRDGLNKFDGYDFTVYTDRATEDLPAITNNYVHDIDVDKNGHLWVGTESGLTVLDPLKNKTKQYTPAQIFGASSSIATVDAITITKYSKRIFIHSHTEKTFDKLYTTAEYRDGTFKKLSVTYKGKTFDHFANVFEGPNNVLWVRPALYGTFFLLDHDYNVVKTLRIPDSIDGVPIAHAFPDRWSVPSNQKFIQNQEFVQIPSDELILGGAVCDGDSIRFLRCNFSQERCELVANIALGAEQMPLNQYFDYSGHLWFPSENGFNVFKAGITQHAGAKEQYVPSPSTTCFFQSRDKTMWVGTNFGVIRIRRASNPFQFSLQSPTNEVGYGRSMRGISKPFNGWIYAGAVHDGLWAYNIQTKEEKQILPANAPGETKMHDILPYDLTVIDGNLWICNWFDDGMLRYNIDTKKLEHIKVDNNTAGFARCMALRSDGNIWLGTDQGLNIIDTKKGKGKLFEPTKAPPGFEKFNIVVLSASKKNTLWIGTQNRGIYYLNDKKEVVHFSKNVASLQSNTVLSMLEYGGYLWVGTSSGLVRIHTGSKKTNVYTERNGLPNAKIYAIESMDNALWLTTDKGICKFDPAQGTFVNYGIQEGIPHEEFNFSSHQKINSTTIVFGSMNGLVEVHAQREATKKTSYPIVLTKMEKFDDKTDRIRPFLIQEGETIDIYPEDKFFSLHFAMLDLFSSESINYAYKLEGYQDKWIPLGTNNSIRFSQLPPGDYMFKVRAQGSNGLWNEKQLSVNIRVHQVFYKTWWFLLINILVLGAIVFAILRYRSRQQRKIQLLRLKIASDLHDDVGGVLTQIGVQAEMIKEGIYNANEEKKQIDHIAANSREAIRAMSDVLWSIDIREEKMHDLITRMKGYALEMLSSKDISVQFTVDEIENKQLNLDFRQNVYLAFKEMINNIVKHSNATHVEITITKKNRFVLRVSDNGTPQPQTKKPGQGLKNLQLRAQRIGGELTVDTDQGYTITLTV